MHGWSWSWSYSWSYSWSLYRGESRLPSVVLMLLLLHLGLLLDRRLLVLMCGAGGLGHDSITA